MAEKKKVYIVTNPGSDSDDSNEDLIRHLRGQGYHYSRRPRHQPAYNDFQQHRPPPQTTADLPPINGSSSLHYPPPQYPILIESNESPTFEEAPAPQVMSPTAYLSQPADLHPKVQNPPKSSLSSDPPIHHDRFANDSTSQQPLVGPRKFPTPKPPFGSRPKPTGDNSRRSRVVRFGAFVYFSLLIDLSVANHRRSRTLRIFGRHASVTNHSFGEDSDNGHSGL